MHLSNFIKEDVSNNSLAEISYNNDISIDLLDFFFDLTKITSNFMNANKITSSYMPAIYVKFLTEDSKPKNIAVFPVFSFLYFTLQECLQGEHYSSAIEFQYQIILNPHCYRHYQKGDFILEFSYYDKKTNSIAEQIIKKPALCIEEDNIELKIVDQFNQMIKDYKEIMFNFVTNSTIPHFDKNEASYHCERFARYDYLQLEGIHETYSEESSLLFFDICINSINLHNDTDS